MSAIENCILERSGNAIFCFPPPDIDECLLPEFAGRCVENAECCNLPAHFTCKCKSGFVGDGFVECRDVDECLGNTACGSNALCVNTVGNHTCRCQQGFAGNPYDGCVDVDECRSSPCGPGAVCTNLLGDYQCSCPGGWVGDPRSSSGCVRGNPLIVSRKEMYFTS